jgi:hypothetical protein
MKTAIGVIIAVVIVIGALYFGVPFLIDKQTSELRHEVQDLKQRLQKIEEESKVAPLQLDADTQKIIKAVNAISLKIISLDDSFKKEMSAMSETIKKQKTTTEEVFRKQGEALDKSSKELQSQIQKIKFDTDIANIRGHILKVKLDLVSRNIGTAKNELSLIDEAFEKVKNSASEENKKLIEELQSTLKKARAEIDTDFASALNKIDLLWHETNKFLKKV